jgi:hypothetical protein
VGDATYTVVATELLLQFGSLPPDEHGVLMFAVLVIAVPGLSPKLAFTTSGKLTGVLVFTASELMVQVIVPLVAPTAGSVPQFHPLGTVKKTNDLPSGIASVKVAAPETAVSLLVMDYV